MASSRAASMSIGHVLKLIKADNMVVVLQQLSIYEIFNSSSLRTWQKLSILNQIFKSSSSKGCSILWMQCLLIFGTGLSGNLSKFTFNQFEEIFSNKFEEIFLLLLIITTFLTPRHNFNTNSAMQIASTSFLHDFCQILKILNVTTNPNIFPHRVQCLKDSSFLGMVHSFWRLKMYSII